MSILLVYVTGFTNRDLIHAFFKNTYITQLVFDLQISTYLVAFIYILTYLLVYIRTYVCCNANKILQLLCKCMYTREVQQLITSKPNVTS